MGTLIDEVRAEQDAQREAVRIRKRNQRKRDSERAKKAAETGKPQHKPTERWKQNRRERDEQYALLQGIAVECGQLHLWMNQSVERVENGLAPETENGLETGRLPQEMMVDLIEGVLTMIELRGFESFVVPPAWKDEHEASYQNAQRTGRMVEFYDFGITGSRIDYNLFQRYADTIGFYIQTYNPTLVRNEWVAKVISKMSKAQPQPAPQAQPATEVQEPIRAAETVPEGRTGGYVAIKIQKIQSE
jgi:hypothetical protein